VFGARFDRFINDVLAAPMRAWEINLGLSLGGVVRALLIGISLTALAIPVTSVPIRQPAELALAVVLTLALFSSLGVIVGIYVTSWDFTGFVNNLIILPLTFLGGVFYSVDVLPSPWHELSHANGVGIAQDRRDQTRRADANDREIGLRVVSDEIRCV